MAYFRGWMMFSLLSAFVFASALGFGAYQGEFPSEEEMAAHVFEEAVYACAGFPGTRIWELSEFKSWSYALRPRFSGGESQKHYSMVIPAIVDEREQQLAECVHHYIENPEFRHLLQQFRKLSRQY